MARQIPYQVETPSIPGSWHGDERRFAIQTNDLMEQIYNQVSTLRQEVAALKKELKEVKDGANS